MNFNGGGWHKVMRIRELTLLSSLLVSGNVAEAVVFADTPDPLHNTTTPGDNSGWQYEGDVGFLGTPVAPYFYITAKHFGGSVGQVFNFHGDSYTTIGYYETLFRDLDHELVTRHHTTNAPDGYTDTLTTGTATDLRIWEVDHAKPFPAFSPLSSGVADMGATATVHGGGAERGDEVTVNSELKGWLWGGSNYRQRWGRNDVAGTVDGGADYGEVLFCNFDKPGIPDECDLSTGDSGGGLFVLENGLWRLAGINLGADSPFRDGPTGAVIYAALYDKGGLEEYSEPPPTWTSVAEQPANIPTKFYCSRISASLPWILSVTGQDGSLAPESYTAWQRLYFTPAEIGTPATTGPLADFDGDGIGNLLEFALNLDPFFNESVTMLPNTGLRGLPWIGVETDHVTLEFVRRTSGSGSGLTYTPQFSSGLDDWEDVGTETVVAINPRWERVKIVDPVTTGSAAKRFARVKVGLAD